MKRVSRRRLILCFIFAVSALAAAVGVVVSSAELEWRLVDDRVLRPAEVIAKDIEHHAASGASIRDYTGFYGAADAAAAAERTLRAIEVFIFDRASGDDGDGRPSLLFEARDVVSPATTSGEMLVHTVPIAQRSAVSEMVWPLGEIRVTVERRSFADRLSESPLLLVAATAVLSLIGLVILGAMAEDDHVAGRGAAATWVVAALGPAVAMCVWLVAASAEYYRESATVAADIAASRLRPAAEMNIDLKHFEGLDEVFPAGDAWRDAALASTNFALVEGLRPILEVGPQVEGFWMQGPLRLEVRRSVRPRSLSAPSLTVAVTLSWRDIALRGLGDHFWALWGIAAYVFAPAFVLALFGRRKA